MRRALLASMVFLVPLWGAPPSHVRTILIQGFTFRPDKLTVQVGDTVEWKNADIVPHTVTASDNAFHSMLIQPNQSWKLVVKKAGTFHYFCTPHPNMRAILVVEPVSAKEQ